MRLFSSFLLFLGFSPCFLQAQGVPLSQSVSPILSDSTCTINCQDPGYRLMTQVIDGETITREYIIHVPSGYQEGDNLPLVIVYHGFGGCAYYMSDETGGLNDLADEENFFVATRKRHTDLKKRIPIGSRASTAARASTSTTFFSQSNS